MELLMFWVIGYLFTFGVVLSSPEEVKPSIGTFFVVLCLWPVILGSILGDKL